MSDQTLNDILEIVNFLKDNVVSKDDIKEFITKDYLDEKLTEVKSEILGDVDRFIKLHETLDQELSALRSKYSRLEERLVVVERKLQLA